MWVLGADAKLGYGGRMKLKFVELEAAALMSEVMLGHGFAHYGYFPDGTPEALTAAALGAGEVRCAGTADRRDDGFSLHSTHCEAAGEMSRCTPFHMKAKGEAKT